jgi:hypothetical protein
MPFSEVKLPDVCYSIRWGVSKPHISLKSVSDGFPNFIIVQSKMRPFTQIWLTLIGLGKTVETDFICVTTF